jgi:hypothetical protein
MKQNFTFYFQLKKFFLTKTERNIILCMTEENDEDTHLLEKKRVFQQFPQDGLASLHSLHTGT